MYQAVSRLFTVALFTFILQVPGIAGATTNDTVAQPDGMCGKVLSSPSDIAIVNGNKLYVTDSEANRILVLSTASHRVEKEMSTPGQTYAIVPSPDGQLAYVLSITSADSLILVIDTNKDKIVRTLTLGPRRVVSLELSRDGSTLYIARLQSNYVSEVHVMENSHAQTREIFTDAIGPTRGKLAIARSRVYSLSSGQLNVVDSTNGSPLLRIPLSKTEEYSLSVSPDESLLALTRWSFENNNLDAVSFIRTVDNTNLTTVPINGDPVSAIFSRDGKVLYVYLSYEKFISTTSKNESLSEPKLPAIAAIDINSDKLIATIPMNGWLGQGVISPDNKRIYYITSAPVPGEKQRLTRRFVTIVDTKTNGVEGEIPLPVPSRSTQDDCPRE